MRSAANHLNYEGVAGEYHPTVDPIGLQDVPGAPGMGPLQRGLLPGVLHQSEAVDHLPRAFAILDGLYRRDPAKFARYSSLALAIALVYDVAPPPYWPHAQVTLQALPRNLPKPEVPFDRLIKEDLAGRTYLRLTRLRAEELKFVVDAAAPVPENSPGAGQCPVLPGRVRGRVHDDLVPAGPHDERSAHGLVRPTRTPCRPSGPRGASASTRPILRPRPGRPAASRRFSLRAPARTGVTRGSDSSTPSAGGGWTRAATPSSAS